jgi:hypothetical protein
MSRVIPCTSTGRCDHALCAMLSLSVNAFAEKAKAAIALGDRDFRTDWAASLCGGVVVPCRSKARAVTGAIASRTFAAGNHNVLASDHISC